MPSVLTEHSDGSTCAILHALRWLSSTSFLPANVRSRDKSLWRKPLQVNDSQAHSHSWRFIPSSTKFSTAQVVLRQIHVGMSTIVKPRSVDVVTFNLSSCTVLRDFAIPRAFHSNSDPADLAFSKCLHFNSSAYR
jgi:hypothetical protein